MNIQKMSSQDLMLHLMDLSTIVKFGWSDTALEVTKRLVELDRPKQPYQIKYKFLPNDRDIDDMKALTVWGTSPLAACQTLVDANDWRGQSMEFQVNEYHFTSDDLE
jgi:hypothetical protein